MTDSFYGAGVTSAKAALSLKSGDPDSSSTEAARDSFVDIALGRLFSVAGSQPQAGSFSPKAISTGSSACSGGGSINLQLNDADNDGVPSYPDVLTFDFLGCKEGSSIGNGRLTMTGFDFSEDSTSRRVAGSFTFSNLAVFDGRTTETANGGFSIQAQYRTTPVEYYQATIAGKAFTIARVGFTGELRDFSLTSQVNLTGSSYAFSFAATYIEPGRGIQATLSMPQAFQGYIGSYPSTGSLRLREVDGSALTLVALTSTSARIDIDANGDGLAESSQVTTWSELK